MEIKINEDLSLLINISAPKLQSAPLTHAVFIQSVLSGYWLCIPNLGSQVFVQLAVGSKQGLNNVSVMETFSIHEKKKLCWWCWNRLTPGE